MSLPHIRAGLVCGGGGWLVGLVGLVDSYE